LVFNLNNMLELELETLKVRGLEHVKKFTWKNCFELTTEVYRELV
jgi:hypothetical protein